VILIEGCDGTGKTTLVNCLAQQFQLNVGQRATRNRDELYRVTRQDTYTALSLAVENKHKPQIWDRLGPFSDPIYSRVTGRGCAFNLAELQFALGILKVLRCPIIFCIVPLETIQDNIAGTHQMDKVEENLSYLAGAYESMAQSMDVITIYDYRVEGAYDRLVEDVIKPYLVRRSDREWHC
jgi:hypothetical protein